MSSPLPWEEAYSPRNPGSPRSLSNQLAYETASGGSTVRRSQASQYDRRSVSDSYHVSSPSDHKDSIDDEVLGENQLDDDPYDRVDYDAPKSERRYTIRTARAASPRNARSPVNLTASLDGRLVVGVDFGTTYSGIAFSKQLNDKECKLTDVKLMTNYGVAMNNQDKIPSIISYSEPTGDERQFGLDLSIDAVAMVNSKLELDVQDTKLAELESLVHALEGMKNLSYKNVKNCKGHPGFTWKSAEQIVTDYLTKMFKTLSPILDRELGSSLRQTVPTDLVVTVPADWSPKAKNSTYRAIMNASLNQEAFVSLKNVFMVTEPEAAALYAIRWLKQYKSEFLRDDDSFILCDAGGGTVDVVAYRVSQVEPKLELEQIGAPTCRKCGSIYIDARFKEWLRNLLGRHWRILDPKSAKGRINAQTTEGKDMRHIMQEFEEYKKNFGHRQREVRFRLPESLKDITVGTDIVNGELRISWRQMQAFFDDCVDGVLSLVEDQVTQAEMEGKRVTNIIMVGGFAESEYLQKEMKKSMSYRDITLHRPEESWTAVVRGAVINGVEHMGDLEPLNACPKNYGICLNENFSGLHDNWDDRYLEESTSRVMALGQLHWLILKGDLLDPKAPRTQSKICPFTFSETQSRKWNFSVYEWDHSNMKVKLPKNYRNTRKELRTVFEVEVDMSGVPLETMQKSTNNGRPYWTADTKCIMTYTAEHKLDVRLIFRGQEVGKCSKTLKESKGSYKDDEDDDDDDDYDYGDSD